MRDPFVGRKNDVGKLRYDLEAQDARRGTIEVLTFGASKYEDRNWEKGMAWGRVYAAAQRHLAAWWTGEETDSESGLPHLDHAACCIHFLQAYTKRQVGKDDRPK
jgi:dATP/dGTP diphosphohydrolase, N-terminal